jgi:poly(hydroxyalkanoate) granule-associated protein
VSDLSAKAAQPWDKLETIFEERVGKALTQLGVPSAQDFQALKTELAALKKKVAALEGAPAAKTAKTASVIKKSPRV